VTPLPLTAFPATKHLVTQGKIMADTYKDFQREPSRAHQCMHESEKDGTRCRAMAMQNNYMCYAHRTDDVVTVIENDMFLIDNLDTHAAIQKAFCDVAARLACNHIDLKRAELLITLLRAASRNLRDAAAARRQALREAAAEAALAATTELPPPNPADPLQNCHPERSSASAPNAVEEPVLSLSKEPAVASAHPQNCHPERSSASAPNAVEGPVLSLSKEPAVASAHLQNCHPERSSASAPNAVEGPAVASPTAATTPRTSPRAPKRVYTDEEKDFLKFTTSSTHYAPVHRPRPESITDDDIIAAINANRRRCSLGPIDTEPGWNKATLSADPIHPPIPSSAKPATPNNAVILSVANGAPGQLAGWGGKNPRIQPDAATPNTAATPNNAVILTLSEQSEPKGKNPRIQPEAPQLCADTSALASRYPEASASGLSPAAQEEGALAPGVQAVPTNNEECTTDNELLTLNAVAGPLPSRAQARRERHEVLSCGRSSLPGTPHWPAAPTAGA
jgi:hypothetical protein